MLQLMRMNRQARPLFNALKEAVDATGGQPKE
jgi:hypothetical protein